LTSETPEVVTTLRRRDNSPPDRRPGLEPEQAGQPAEAGRENPATGCRSNLRSQAWVGGRRETSTGNEAQGRRGRRTPGNGRRRYGPVSGARPRSRLPARPERIDLAGNGQIDERGESVLELRFEAGRTPERGRDGTARRTARRQGPRRRGNGCRRGDSFEGCDSRRGERTASIRRRRRRRARETR